MTLPVATALAMLALSSSAPRSAVPVLRFADLLEQTGDALRPSSMASLLAGKRVRLYGFMAQMEDPPRGGFWLVPRPVECDESGQGTGDLPPNAVFVVVRSAAGSAVPFRPGALSVTGILDLGSRADAEGHVSAIRVVLDRPSPVSRSPSRRSTPGTEVHR